MKKLPNIFQNEFNKNIKNNKEVAYVKEEKNDIDEIDNIINLLFNGTTYVYNIPIITITTISSVKVKPLFFKDLFINFPP